MSKTLPKIQLLMASLGFMYAFFAFVLYYEGLFDYLFISVIPFLVLFMILPYTIVFIKYGMNQIKPFVINILLSAGIGLGVFLHHVSLTNNAGNGYAGAYNNPIIVVLGYLVISAIAVGLSLKFLFETRGKDESDELIKFSCRTILYIFVMFLNIFIFVGENGVSWIAIFSLVVMITWFVSEIMIMTKKYSIQS
jgi:hypothetical protein